MTAEEVAARVAATREAVARAIYGDDVYWSSLTDDERESWRERADRAIAAALGAGEGSESAGLRADMEALADRWSAAGGWVARGFSAALRAALAARAGGDDGSGGEAG